jgi:single-strand DNA-binding protein
MSKATISIEGFVANEVGIRDAKGHRVLDVSIPVTPQKPKPEGGWEDTGPTVWYRASFWDEHADALLGLVEKSSLVHLQGGVKVEPWERNGRSGINLIVTNPVLVPVRRSRAAAVPAAYAAPSAEAWHTATPGVPVEPAPLDAAFYDDTPF